MNEHNNFERQNSLSHEELCIRDAFLRIPINAKKLKACAKQKIGSMAYATQTGQTSKIGNNNSCGRFKFGMSTVAVLAFALLLYGIFFLMQHENLQTGVDGQIEQEYIEPHNNVCDINNNYSQITEYTQTSRGSIAIDNGIRMEVISSHLVALRPPTGFRETPIDDTLLLVSEISVQDVSGQNRLGWGVTFPFANRNMNFSSSYRCFDEDTNTVYFTLTNIIGWDSYAYLTYDRNLVHLDVERIFYGNDFQFEFEAIVPITELLQAGISPTIPFSNEYFTSVWQSYAPVVLEPQHQGVLPTLPNMLASQWITGIAVVENRLHVQHVVDMYRDANNPDGFHQRGGSGFIGGIGLLDSDGSEIIQEYSTIFLKDENWEFVSMETGNLLENSRYIFSETVFAIDRNNLEEYSVHFNNSLNRSISGDWQLALDVSDSSSVRTWESDITQGNITLNEFSLYPTGLFVSATSPRRYFPDGVSSDMIRTFIINIVTPDGEIPLVTYLGALWVGDCDDIGVFSGTLWHSYQWIDVANATYLIINGERFPIP